MSQTPLSIAVRPTVGCVLPVHNAESTIARAVHSILGQTISDLELIVVDDGSTDNTAAVLAAIDDERMHVIHTPHQGVARATNVATAYTTAPFIARMDADDIADAARFESQMAFLTASDLDVVGSQVRIVDTRRQPATSMQRYERWINEETLTPKQIVGLRFVELPLVNPTIFAKRAYFDLQFREGNFPEDYDLMLRGVAAGLRFGKVAEKLLVWTDGPQRLTRNDDRYSPEAFDRCRRTHLREGPLADVERVDLWGVGQTGKRWLRWLQSAGIPARRAIDVNERKLNTQIHNVPIIGPNGMPAADGTPLIIAVGAAGARDLIRPHITKKGYSIGEDAWFVA